MTKCPHCDWMELDGHFYAPSVIYLLLPHVKAMPQSSFKQALCGLCSLSQDSWLAKKIHKDFGTDENEKTPIPV